MKFLIIIFSIVSFNILACDSKSYIINSDIQIWLGKKSEFAKTLNKSKCILDKELAGLSLNNKKLVKAMRSGNQLVINGISSRGTKTKDIYSLLGFTSAHNVINRTCK